MAGDWIKIEHSLPGKPEVMRMASILGISEAAVVGHLVRFWSWVDQNMSQKCPSVFGTKLGLDSRAGWDGFCDAMVEVGWLKFVGEQIEIPNYDHHLSQSAKQRAFESKRKSKQRKNVPQNVPKMSQKVRDKSGTKGGTREEKRREDIHPLSEDVCDTHKRGAFVPPTVAEVRAYCESRKNKIDAERFVDHYTARGWIMTNGKKVQDWQACVRTWEKNDGRFNSGAAGGLFGGGGGNSPSRFRGSFADDLAEALAGQDAGAADDVSGSGRGEGGPEADGGDA